MRTLLLVITSALAVSMQAKEALVDGGRSKDGHYEVLIVEDPDSEPSDYVFDIVDTQTRKRLARVEDAGGILRYNAARGTSRALWDDSSSFVVFTDQGTRHSLEIYAFYVSGASATRIALPDYVQNALGRVDATQIDLHCLSAPKRWDGTKLNLELGFSVSNPARGRVFYSCDVTLGFHRGDSSASLLRVTQPKSDDRE